MNPLQKSFRKVSQEKREQALALIMKLHPENPNLLFSPPELKYERYGITMDIKWLNGNWNRDIYETAEYVPICFDPLGGFVNHDGPELEANRNARTTSGLSGQQGRQFPAECGANRRGN